MRSGKPWSRILALVAWSSGLLLSSILDPSGLRAAFDNPEDSKPVSYFHDVLPILQANCLGCHQPAKAQGNYVMTDFAKMLGGGESGTPAIVPGDVASSHLIDLIVPKDGKAEMPRGKAPLNEIDIDTIKKWIAQGAKDDSPDSKPSFNADHPPIYELPPVITSIDVSPDGNQLAMTGFHEILLYDTSNWTLRKRLIGLSPRVESLRFSPDGSMIAATAGRPGLQGEVQVWKTEDGSLLLSQVAGHDTPFGLSWSPDSKLVAFGGADNIVRAIDVQSGERKLYQGAHEDWPRATVFTVSGEHVLSAGRDMTVKLTELATERFIDNVTSITPGALRGGVSSLARHPARDEILVGGSDGSPKLYRVFRQTARQIGDDANLIRKLPDMPGRISSVAISPDAKYLAAVSTLDHVSQIRVWLYDVDSQMPENIKSIQSKTVFARTAEEKKALETYVTAEPAAVVTWEVPETSVYAISLDKHGRLAAGGADGKIRVWDCESKQPITTFDAVPSGAMKSAADGNALANSRSGYLDRLASTTQSAPVRPEAAKIDLTRYRRLEVVPDRVELHRWSEYQQLLVKAVDDSGKSIDVTPFCRYSASGSAVVVGSGGWVQARATGESSIEIRIGELVHSLPAKVHQADIRGIEFMRDVNPVLSRLGCNAGTCHGAQAGKNGFKLSLRGYDPIFDVRALTDDLAGRRISLTSPHDSLMLSKPLGVVAHEGGQLIKSGDLFATILEQWIREGASLKLDSVRVARIEIFPINPVVEEIGMPQQLRVVATYADGSTRDVTREAFIESGNGEVATIADGAVATGIRRGEAPLLARFEGTYAATTLTIMGKRDDFVWREPPKWNQVDEFVASKWQRMKISPSDLCTDAEFLRRIYLDLVGLPPTAEQVRAFIYDPRETRAKRQAIIDQLLASEEFVDHWTNKWSDLLQVNSKFLGKEGAQSFKDWIRQQVASNVPYDQFVRSIVTASGSNRTNPAASYYKILRTPEEALENTTHLFLAVRFNCNKCHDHPFERWTQDQYYETAAYFTQVGIKKDEASGDRMIGGTAVEGAKPLFEEIFDTNAGEMTHQRTAKITPPKFPFQCDFEAPPEPTRRKEFAQWLTSKSNPYFARSYVNRMWGYLLGTGLIEPLDDIRAGNPAANPELLQYLEKEFKESGFNVKHVMRLICESRVYQLSIDTNPMNSDDHTNYSHAKARRLPAEVLFDSIHRVTGTTSKIPGLAEGTRAASLADADAGLPDGFLNNLGRPARESACECERSSDLQLGSIMALVSGPTLGTAIAEKQNTLHQLAAAIPDDRQLISEVFYRVLNRPATEAEIDVAMTTFARIKTDHEGLQAQLQKREAWWAEEKIKREEERVRLLAETQKAVGDREVEIKPERERLEKERLDRIAKAEADKRAYQDSIPGRIQEFLDQRKSSVEWSPLAARSLSATNGAVLVGQPDRSIRADGKKEKGSYHVVTESGLNTITAVRLEALPIPEIPGGGPGLPGNGNFVITEVELFAGPKSTPEQRQKVKFKKAQTDFDQPGFSAAALIDGNQQDQGGWAIHDAGGVEHWTVMQLEQPLTLPSDWSLEFRIHQYHEAAEHRLGRFRLSVTSQVGDIPLGLTESLTALSSTPVELRTTSSIESATAYFTKIDKTLAGFATAIQLANGAVPEDEKLVSLRKRVDKLSQPISEDSVLVRLRSDAQQSQAQLSDVRVTASEDLTWALINSPAFLFNH